MRELQKRGLISSVRDENDRRALRCMVTDRGVKVLRGLHSTFRARVAEAIEANELEDVQASLEIVLRSAARRRALREMPDCRELVSEEERGRARVLYVQGLV